MKAALFFRVIKHGRKIYARERNLFLRDLADIGVIPNAPQNYKEVREHFTKRAFPESKRKALAADDVRTFQMAEAMFRGCNPNMMGAPRGRH